MEEEERNDGADAPNSTSPLLAETTNAYGSGSIQTQQDDHHQDEGHHEEEKQPPDPPLMSNLEIAAVLSYAAAYACVTNTFFLLTGPVECRRIENESTKYYSYSVNKSLALGGFAFLAGSSQLITPILGLITDSYVPRKEYRQLHRLGNRLPYLILGTIMVFFGLVGQLWSSSPIHGITVLDSEHDIYEENYIPIPVGQNSHIVYGGAWIQYTICFFLSMVGLNIAYTIMLVFIPDLGEFLLFLFLITPVTDT